MLHGLHWLALQLATAGYAAWASPFLACQEYGQQLSVAGEPGWNGQGTSFALLQLVGKKQEFRVKSSFPRPGLAYL
jgi:hypothetical protein